MINEILIVEDEAIVLLDMKLELEGIGYTVYSADNGLDAIKTSSRETTFRYCNYGY